jgi:hypothetical protein
MMKRFILLATIACAALLLSYSRVPVPKPIIVKAQSEFVGQVKSDSVSIRMIVLRHCWDKEGVSDARQAIQAVNVGASKGLTIEQIGNYNINRHGAINSNVSWSDPMNFAGLKRFVSKQMNINAETGDTFIIYTIGHGGGDGSLVTLGQRADVMKIFAEAAAEQEQETFWWQLSCHATARLPAISSLTEEEQSYFSMMASSSAADLSYFESQGAQMRTVFNAMANKSSDIDPNGDETITAGEFKAFLNKHVRRGSFPSGHRGDLLFARSDDEPIFSMPLAIKIPIVDRDNPQRSYERNYIAIPSRKYN